MASELGLKSVSSLLTEDILKNVVKDIYDKKSSREKSIPDIVSYKVDYASSKGDGYMGIVYRINIVLSNDTSLNIIGKGMPPNVVRRKTYACASFFSQEVYFFNEVVPMFREYEKMNLGRNDNTLSLLTIPECYYAISDGMNDFLLLEDLCERGYGMFDRVSGLTPEQISEILKKIARLHAYSFAVKSKNLDKFKKITSNMTPNFLTRENEERLSAYLLKVAEIVLRAVKEELKDSKYLAKFEKFIENKEILYKNLVNLMDAKEPAVIIHGDCWSTNFMQKVSHGKLQVQTIDFQLIRYCSPINDIAVFIFSCTTIEQRNEMGGVEKMLQIYHDELSSAVSALGAPNSNITLQELRQHWREVGAIGLGYAFELVLLSIVEPSDVMDLDKWEGEEAIPLVDITHFNEVSDTSGKKRLADLVRLAVDEGMM